jgi:hypothetical protein
MFFFMYFYSSFLLVFVIKNDRGIPFYYALQRHNAENSKQIFPEKELRSHSSNFHIHVPEWDLYIPTIDLPILLQEICRPILGIYKSLTDT